jgi:hypothetical protein
LSTRPGTPENIRRGEIKPTARYLRNQERAKQRAAKEEVQRAAKELQRNVLKAWQQEIASSAES